MPISVTPIPRLVELTTPAFTLGTSNAAGAALTAVASNSTILTYDTTLPAAVGTPATGSAATAARRDHGHGGTSAITSVNDAIARFNGTAGQLQGYTSNTPTIGDSGIGTAPGQPAFMMTLSGDDANVTGDGSLYTLGTTGNVLTENFDQSGEITTAGVFTPTVAGIYLLGCSIQCVSVPASANNFAMSIVTTTQTRNRYGNLYNDYNSGSAVAWEGMSALFQMAASNTAVVTFSVSGMAKTIDVHSSGSTFWGVKIA